MNLHIGCGHVILPGFVNVDRSRDSAADVIADARSLPFKDNVFPHVEAPQIIEHLGYTGAVFALAEWRRVCSAQATLAIETPDIDASFTAFASAIGREEKAQRLGWIFGDESEGQNHVLLFPRDMLLEMLARAGFDPIREETPLTWPSEPGLRIVCARSDSRFIDALCAVKAAAFAGGFVRSNLQTEVVEFENGFVRNAWFLDADPKREELIAENVAICAPLASLWIKASARTGAIAGHLAEAWLKAAGSLADLGLQQRMHNCFRSCGAGGAGLKDGYERVLEKGAGAAFTAAREGWADPRCLDDAGLTLPNEDRQSQGAAGGSFFGKIRCVEYAERLRNRGLRLFARGEIPESERLLRASAGLRVEPLYALWNLAALLSARGELDAALDAYDDAMAVSPDASRVKVAQDAAIAAAHAGLFDKVLAIVSENPAMDGSAAMKSIALASMGLSTRNVCDPLPPLRTWPVMVGEGVTVKGILNLENRKPGKGS